MSIPIILPEGNIILKSANSVEDNASHLLIHNQNMKEIQLWLRSFKVALEEIAESGGSSSSVDAAAVRAIIQSSKYNVRIPVNMSINQEIIDANGFKVKRVMIASGAGAESSEYQISDTVASRNFIFSKAMFTMKKLNGTVVYPSIVANLTNVRLMFRHYSETSATPGHTPANTDPNTKILTIF